MMKFAQLEHTKMLFPATELVPSHPTDPVELRRLHYQTPGTILIPHTIQLVNYVTELISAFYIVLEETKMTV